MKKILALTICLLFAFMTVSADVSFPDLQSDHWAYASVSELVNDGTIGGYEDGTFRPDGIVTRAEFVKMIGKGDVASNVEYSDVPAEHWAYDYIKYSGLSGITDTTFEPDTPITRGDVADLIWRRNGADTTATAPSAVLSQGGASSASTAWVYENGIMNGNDGVNLRLGDSLTRAEAAALIVRARNVGSSTVKKDFITTVNDGVLKTVFDSTALIDGVEYSADRKVTNGEVAMAVARYMEGLYTPRFDSYPYAGSFESEYSRAVGFLCNEVWGKENNTLEFANKTATVKDTIAAFAYALSIKKGDTVTSGDYYGEITANLSDSMNKYLTYAKQNNIMLLSGGRIDAESDVTLNKFAAILLQFDSISGFNAGYVSDSTVTNKVYNSVALSTDSYPSTASAFQVVLNEIPFSVYEAAFADMKYPHTEKYSFCHAYAEVFNNALRQVVEVYKNVGTDINITFYPSMVCDNGNGVTMRLKVDVKELAQSGTFGTLFDVHDEFENVEVVPGMTFYADFVTGQEIAGIFLPLNTMEFTDIILAY